MKNDLPMHRRPQRGLTLIECMVSMVLFLIVSVGIVGGSASYLKMNTINEQKSAAISATQQVLDTVRVSDPATLPTSGQTSQTVAVGGRNFTVSISYCQVFSYCTSGTVRHLTASTSFRGKQLYTVEKRSMRNCNNRNAYSVSNQRGYTIAELLVSMTIGMMVTALTLSSSMINRYTIGKDVARTRLNQNLRGSLDLVGLDVRVSGENLNTSFRD